MPITFQENIDENTSIGLWKITETPEELEQKLQLKEHELLLLHSLSKEKRNLHWLATRVLLRKMLDTHEYIDCQADEYGKPILMNHPHHISLSHSYDYAAVIVSRTKKVGIDIEIIKDKIVRVQNKFMNDAEFSFIKDENRREQLYVCWCAKEAVYKLHGKKEISFKDHIHLGKFNYAESGQLQARIEKDDYSEEFTVNFRKLDGYMLGYVTEK
jgi:4'-phosphopantetheinyl transferase